jgi:hypothetical protein
MVVGISTELNYYIVMLNHDYMNTYPESDLCNFCTSNMISDVPKEWFGGFKPPLKIPKLSQIPRSVENKSVTT